MKKLTSLALVWVSLLGGLEAGELKVDQEKSRVQVDAKATGHSFTGTLEKYEVKVEGDEVSLEPKSCRLSWKFEDLKTGDGKRDKEMLKWLGGGSPEGSFRFIKMWKDGGQLKAQGELKIHGVSKVVAFPYAVKKDGEWVTIDGTVEMDYEDFGLPIIRAMAVMTVDPKLEVRFHLVGKAN